MNLVVTSGDAIGLEKRFDVSKTLSDLKDRLVLLTGINADDQSITLYESNETNAKCLGALTDDGATLEALGVVKTGMRIHVTDKSGKTTAALFEDLNSVPKYVMSDSDYDKRDDSYRKFKQRQQQNAEAPKEKTTADYPDIKLGARCLVDTGHRGEVAFFGSVDGKPGLFVGVRLDDPFGKNDGTADGKRYFDCMPKCGVFLRPEKIQIGNYPAEDDEI